MSDNTNKTTSEQSTVADQQATQAPPAQQKVEEPKKVEESDEEEDSSDEERKRRERANKPIEIVKQPENPDDYLEKDISPDKDGGILKRIISKGRGFLTPKKGADVKVHYTGTLTDGTKFDSSRDRDEPFTFKIGHGQVIKGWDEGIKTMRKGEKSVLTLKPEYAYGAAGSPPKIPPNATLIFEVEMISWNDEQDVARDGGIMKKVHVEGGGGYETPREDGTAKITYKGYLPDGTVFEEKTEFSFVVGTEQVILGLEKAVESMKKGEKCTARIQPNYGYGAEGSKELGIPPNAEIHYDIELLEFQNDKEPWEMETPQKLELAERSKNEGNELFKINKIARAVKKYNKSVRYVDSDYSMSDEEKAKAKQLKVPCYLNLALCSLKNKEYQNVLEHCKKVLEIEPENVKALFRRGTAYCEMDEWKESMADLKKALELDPTNKEVKAQLAKLNAKIKAQNDKDKKTFGNMFAKLAKMEEKEQTSDKKEEKQGKTAVGNEKKNININSQVEPMDIDKEKEN